MLQIRLRGHADPEPTVTADLLTAGPWAGCVAYTLDPDPGVGATYEIVSVTTVDIVGGDPGDVRRAAAILRAQAWWIAGHAASYGIRVQADRLDALAQDLEG